MNQDATYQWLQWLSISKPSISQRSQIKEDTVEPSVPAVIILTQAIQPNWLWTQVTVAR